MPRRSAALTSSPEAAVQCRPLTPDDFSLLEQLFGANGACGGCWCMWWRSPLTGALYKAQNGAPNKAAMQQLVLDGEAQGILALAGERPVGWCTFGPRTDFPRLGRSRVYTRTDLEGVWSIPCFFVHRTYRGQGVARALLQTAIDEMRRQGASWAEAYPVPLTKSGERLPATFAFTGPLSLFESLGFAVIQRSSHSRPLVRLQL